METNEQRYAREQSEPRYVGERVEVRPAYDSDTGARTHRDEVTDLAGTVTALRPDGQDVDILTPGGRTLTLNRGRCRHVD